MKNIDIKEKVFNPGYTTEIYEPYIYTNNLKVDNLIINLESLTNLNLSIKGWKGFFSFKLSVGPSYYLSIGDELTIDFEIFLNYTLKISYDPFFITNEEYSYNIPVYIDSNKIAFKLLSKIVLKFIKNKINNIISNYLKEFPKVLQNLIKSQTKEYLIIFLLSYFPE